MDKRFAQLRNLLTLQMTYPGKKLLFMGVSLVNIWNGAITKHLIGPS